MTFEHDSDVRSAIKQMNNPEKPLRKFGQPIQVTRAEEPSNYIWENMHYTTLRQSRWFTYVMIGIALVLWLGYWVQIRLQATISYIDNYEKFDCNQFHNGFGNTIFEREDLKNIHLDTKAIRTAEAEQYLKGKKS